MKIEKSTIVKKAMHRHSHVVTNAKNSSKSVCTRAQMGNLAKELERMPFLLQRISFRIGRSINLNFVSLNFDSLSFSQGLNNGTGNTDTCSCSNGFQVFVAKFFIIGYYLDIIYSRTIVQRNKAYVFITAAGTHPAFDIHLCTIISTF